MLRFTRLLARTTRKPKSPRPLLKYDIGKPGAFLDFGVLPFFQRTLNAMGSRSNLEPTLDQRSILSVLASKHNLILRGASRSGKLVAILVHALGLAMTRVPNYGMVDRTDSPDAVVVVPTNEMVDRYMEYTKVLTHGMAERPCALELVRDESDPNKMDVVRAPLHIQFNFSDRTERYKSSEGDVPPQIVVTTVDRIGDASDVRFVAVDDAEHLLTTTDIGGITNFTRKGNKKKYVLKLEQALRQLQRTHLETYEARMDRHLKYLELKKTLDEKKTTKERRRFLYKPIQFCFTMRPRPFFHQFMHHLGTKQAALPEVQRLSQIRSSDDVHLQMSYSKYLAEAEERRQYVDAVSSILERAIIDTPRRRRTLLLGDFEPGRNKLIGDTATSNAGMTCTLTDGTTDIDVMQAVFSRVDLMHQLEARAGESNNNLKNMAKNFIRGHKPTDLVRLKDLKTPADCVVVVPPHIDADTAAKATGRRVVHPHQLVGHAAPSSCLVLFGLETLIPQLAFGTSLEYVAAIEPTSDLVYFYVDNLLASFSRDTAKRLVVVVPDSADHPKLLDLIALNELPRVVTFTHVNSV